MPSFVVCGGVPPPAVGGDPVLYLDVGDRAKPGTGIELKLHHLIQPMVENLPPVLADALEIAVYVYSADRLIRRGSATLPKMGWAWRRNLHFKIPVRQLDVWERPEVQASLTDALTFLSEDEFTFEFVGGRDTLGLQLYLDYSDPSAQKVTPDEVLLFSGGLDSLAGAVTQLFGERKTLALVSHLSATHIARHQRELVQELRKRSHPGRLIHSALWVRKGDAEPVEFTQRTRSFLFYALGVAVARMYNLDTVHVAENGITTFNIPIAENVVGSRASRTTHPRVLADFSKLFSLVLDRPTTIENRHLWQTKSELVREIVQHDCVDMIPRSTSCAGVRNLSMSGKHCGVCSQCVERRFSIIAAGLDGCESADDYEIDTFTGAHKSGHDAAYAEQYVLRARRIASVSQDAFLAEYGQVFRALPFLPGQPDRNARSIYDLHRRHAAAVIAVINKQLSSHADIDGVFGLPRTSLLAMIQSAAGVSFPVSDPIHIERKPSVEASLDRAPITNRQFIMGIDRPKKLVLFAGGAQLSGKDFEVISYLVEVRESELSEEAAVGEYSFVGTEKLARHFKIEDETFRRRIHRLREKLSKQFTSLLNYTPDINDVIETDRWNGYRLNPHVLLVKPAQIRSGDRASRKLPEEVTHPRHPQ